MGLFPGAWICVEGGAHCFHTLEQMRSTPTPACCNNAGAKIVGKRAKKDVKSSVLHSIALYVHSIAAVA